MPKNPDLFRQNALDRLATPEELDRTLKVTSPRAWLVAAALVVIVVSAVAWSFLGVIPRKVQGEGILLKAGGIQQIVANGTGQIEEVNVYPGQKVQPGQIVARISRPELDTQINGVRRLIAELRERYEELLAYANMDTDLRETLLRERRQSLEDSLETLRNRREHLSEKIENQEELHREGLLTLQTLAESRLERDRVEHEIAGNRNELQSLEVESLSTDHERRERINQLETRLSEEEIKLEELLLRRDLETRVVSRFTGRVIEIMKNEGAATQPGTPVVRLELLGRDIQDLQAVFFIDPRKGQQVAPGMTVQISPSTVRREEDGVIVGRVLQVSEYPATPEAMMEVLSNESLVQTLSSGGAPVQAWAELIPDEATPTGYRWTSGQGPDVLLRSGILCEVSVVVEEKPPITLLLPALRRWLGV